MYGTQTQDLLKGRVLQSVELVDAEDDGKDDWKPRYRQDMSQELRLVMSDGSVEVFGPMGDCCSVTWIEHLTVPRGLPSEITGVRELGMMPTDGNKQEIGMVMHGHEWVRFYMTLFETEAGEVVVEYRNSSNGYYGGDLVHVRSEGGSP